jgi:MFS family permease
MLVLIQTLIGVGHLAVWLSSQSIVTYVGEGQRDKAISRMSFFTAIGQLFGPLFGGWILDHYSFQYVFGFYSSIAFLLIMSYPLVKKSVTQVPDRSIRINFISAYVHGGKLYKHNKGVRVATFISFNLAFILFIRVSYLPIYLESKHYSATNIGFLVGLWSFASIFVRPITSFLMHYAGRFWTTNIALLTSVGGLVCLTVASSWPGMIATLVILGIGTGLNQPLAISLVSQYTSSVNRGLGMGIRLMANRMANWISPLTIGSISYYTGLAKAFSIAAIPLSFISGFAIYHLFHLFQRNSNTNEQGVEGHEFRKHT